MKIHIISLPNCLGAQAGNCMHEKTRAFFHRLPDMSKQFQKKRKENIAPEDRYCEHGKIVGFED